MSPMGNQREDEFFEMWWIGIGEVVGRGIWATGRAARRREGWIFVWVTGRILERWLFMAYLECCSPGDWGHMGNIFVGTRMVEGDQDESSSAMRWSMVIDRSRKERGCRISLPLAHLGQTVGSIPVRWWNSCCHVL
jgi:hypothetical protein